LKTSLHTIHISPTLGDVSAEVIEPEKLKCILTLAHGAGAGMHHPFMIALSTELAALDIGTLRFNFPFTEQKKKRPDVPAVAHKTIEAAIQKTKELFPSMPLFASGKSFGGTNDIPVFSKAGI
jgi:predicted alpha/beta-hydrolase family hydrolase